MPTLNSPAPTEHFQVTALRQLPTSQARMPLLVTETALPTSSAPAIRPSEHAFLAEMQQQPMQQEQLPLQTPIQFVIGIGVFLMGLLIVNIGDADDDGGDVVDIAHPAPDDEETVAGGDVVDTAHPVPTDEETVAGGDVVDAAQSVRTDQDSIVGGDVVDAAHPARSDGGTVAGGDSSKPWKKTHRGTRGGKNKKKKNAPPDTQPDASATGPSDLPLMSEYQGSQQSAQAQEPVNTQSQESANEANDSGLSSRNRHGRDGADDMAAAAVQQAPVDNNSAVNDSADEQPAGSTAEPGNSEPWKTPRKSKRGVLSQQPDEEPERYGQQSNEDQAPTTAFSSNDRRYNRTKKW
ncbi:hypothetical protein GGI13_003891 [Coemansia sp. RSA 455]|nr:hypothetical protein GGI13_003891 [Coemansia sp. RSA 455]